MEILNNKSTFNSRNQLIAFLFFFFIIALTWQLLKQNNISSKGVFTIGRIIKTETLKGGFVSTIGYYFENKKYEATVRSKYGSENVGDLYFIKLIPNQPSEIVFLEDSRVPDCLLTMKPPDKGWKAIPGCP